jgi:hypothetical protein
MDYNKKYDLRKGIKWIQRNLKQQRWQIKGRVKSKVNILIDELRIEILQNVLNAFRKRNKNG